MPVCHSRRFREGSGTTHQPAVTRPLKLPTPRDLDGLRGRERHDPRGEGSETTRGGRRSAPVTATCAMLTRSRVMRTIGSPHPMQDFCRTLC